MIVEADIGAHFRHEVCDNVSSKDNCVSLFGRKIGRALWRFSTADTHNYARRGRHFLNLASKIALSEGIPEDRKKAAEALREASLQGFLTILEDGRFFIHDPTNPLELRREISEGAYHLDTGRELTLAAPVLS